MTLGINLGSYQSPGFTDFLTEMVSTGQKEARRVFVDGAAGVGVVLISPTGEKIKLALKLSFWASNNEAEYESVLAGMRAARSAGASRVKIYSDSQLVMQQVQGSYETREKMMVRYLKAMQQLAEGFQDWRVEQIPREENSEAKALAKMATCLEGTQGSGGWEVLNHNMMVSTIESEAVTPAVNSWMRHILIFILSGTLPENPAEARRIRRQAYRFTVVNEALYHRSYQGPLLKWIMFFERYMRDVAGTISGESL